MFPQWTWYIVNFCAKIVLLCSSFTNSFMLWERARENTQENIFNENSTRWNWITSCTCKHLREIFFSPFSIFHTFTKKPQHSIWNWCCCENLKELEEFLYKNFRVIFMGEKKFLEKNALKVSKNSLNLNLIIPLKSYGRNLIN